MPCHERVTQGNSGDSHEAEREEELWARAFIVVFAGRNRQIGVSRFRISWFQSFQLALGCGAVLSCPVPGPGANRAGGQCPEGESPIEEVAGSVNPALGGFYWKVTPSERGDGDEGSGDQSKVTQCTIRFSRTQCTQHMHVAASSLLKLKSRLTQAHARGCRDDSSDRHLFSHWGEASAPPSSRFYQGETSPPQARRFAVSTEP